jgi:adenine phosphoribosyltransferase
MSAGSDLRNRLRHDFKWVGDRWDTTSYADMTGWWRDADLLRSITRGLVELAQATDPTVVVGLQSRGFLLGSLVAQEMGLGFVEVRKNPGPHVDSDEWVIVTTPPDYNDRNLRLGFRRRLVTPDDRVVLVDDWIDTGGQAMGVRHLVELAHARWAGVVVVVDDLRSSAVRRDLDVRALVHSRDL